MLLVDPSVAHFAWEAIIGSRIRQGWGWLLGTSTQFVRAADVLPREPTGLGGWSSASIQIVARAGLATEAWNSTKNAVIRSVETFRAVPTASNRRSAPDAALRVLHLIGRARRGASGSVFSIGGQGSNLGELVNIDRLPLSDTMIVVIQEEPAERVRRLDVDREQAADARDWAAQVFRAGAHTVIFIPAMPLALAEQSIGAMAAKLSVSQAPDVWCMIEAARAARGVVSRFKGNRGNASASAPGPGDGSATRADDLRELAMEITLFTRSEELQPLDFTVAKGPVR